MSVRKQPLNDEFKSFVRELRTQSTVPEQLLWSLLRNRRLAGLKFRRQHPIAPYVVDYYCTDTHLVVELDGLSHEGRFVYDARRTAYLESLGNRVFRVSNDDVLSDLEAVGLGVARAAGIDVEAWMSGRWKPGDEARRGG